MLDIAILANSVQHDGSGLRSLKAFEVCWFEALLFATCSAARHTSNICALALDLSDVLEVAQESYTTHPSKDSLKSCKYKNMKALGFRV